MTAKSMKLISITGVKYWNLLRDVILMFLFFLLLSGIMVSKVETRLTISCLRVASWTCKCLK